jgi:hypothetical protein
LYDPQGDPSKRGPESADTARQRHKCWRHGAIAPYIQLS